MLAAAPGVCAEPGAAVEQIIDVSAHSKEEMFRFSPKVTRVAEGTTVRFTGTTGRHTVTLIRKMAPEGVRSFDIRGQAEMDVVFDRPGVYGVRCRVHGRHGMVMLIAVGDEWSNLEAAKAHMPELEPAEQAVFEKLFSQLEG